MEENRMEQEEPNQAVYHAIGYDQLLLRCRSMVTTFRAKGGYYHIPNYIELENIINNLEKNYTERSGKGKTRREQIKFLMNLVNRLPEVVENSPEESQKEKIILGALIFRALRLQKKDSQTNFLRKITFIAPRQCILSQILQEKLSTAHMDSVVIKESCLAFQHYLHEGQPEHWRDYPYISEDPEFFNHLKKLIDSHSKLPHSAIQKSSDYAKFIESLPVAFAYCDSSIDEKLSDVLQNIKKIPQASITRDTFKACIPDNMKAFFLEVGLLPECDEEWDKEEINSQVLIQKARHASHQALIGALIFIYCQHDCEDALKVAIEEKLDHQPQDWARYQPTLNNLIKVFKIYVNHIPGFCTVSQLKIDAWKTEKDFKAHLERTELAVQEAPWMMVI